VFLGHSHSPGRGGSPHAGNSQNPPWCQPATRSLVKETAIKDPPNSDIRSIRPTCVDHGRGFGCTVRATPEQRRAGFSSAVIRWVRPILCTRAAVKVFPGVSQCITSKRHLGAVSVNLTGEENHKVQGDSVTERTLTTNWSVGPQVFGLGYWAICPLTTCAFMIQSVAHRTSRLHQ
jgi:hypothetical protein